MRKDGWAYWTTGLPYDLDALEDLQRLADELGVTKAEANRLLLIAYSKSTRGTWSQLWGLVREQWYSLPPWWNPPSIRTGRRKLRISKNDIGAGEAQPQQRLSHSTWTTEPLPSLVTSHGSAFL